MTFFYPDISNHNFPVSVSGQSYVMAKATEGTSFVDPDYVRYKASCNAKRIWFAAYHFLHAGNAQAQAEHARSVVIPNVGLMIDCEPTGSSRPTTADVSAFTTAARALDLRVHLLYLPHWYWLEMGEPDLTWTKDMSLNLVSSDYTTYSDTGPGWEAYGGVTPAIWQYTDTQNLNGEPVDFNAFKGTLLDLERMTVQG